MISISVQDISLSFGTDVILKDVSFALEDGDRLGIIGVNGAGKTSLFRIISGEYSADSGQVYIQRGHKIGVLEQNPNLNSLPDNLTCLEYMYTAFDALLRLEEQIAALEEEISQSDAEKSIMLAERLSELSARFADGGGLEFRSRCRGMLLRLGFTEEIINRKISTLSGGQYTRLALARLLATEPDILMLDEPTNHLDIDALEWLEGFLATYKKTVIIISHDRYFLDRTTSKTLRIQNSRARLFHGSYTACLEEQEREAASLEKKYKEQQKVIAKIRANIEFQRRCNREHNFVTIRSKEKQLARMELVERAEKAPRDIRLSFSAEEATANDVISVNDLAFSYGNAAPIINGLSFLVRRSERVMVLGPNGCGKSTLMRLINLALTPTRGKITHGYNVKVGYYDQEMRGLCETKTVFSELHDEYPEKKELEIRSTLALFLFGEDDIEKPVSTLSGGERARLTLAKLILKKVNLLIMDEPTNHLDIGSAEALENALLAFPGTIIAVSHDRYFINRIATRIIELDPTREGGRLDYELSESDEAFTEYMRLRTERRMAAAENEKGKSAEGRAEYEEKKRESAKKRSEERAVERARVKAKELEEELERLNEELFGEAASDYLRAAEIEKRKGEIEEELLSLYELIL